MGWNLRLVGIFFALTLAFSSQPAFSVDDGSTATPPVKEWTFLVFLNGHNDLDRFGDLNLNHMERVGSSDQVNIVVQWASLRANTTKRLYVQKDNNATQVTSPVVDNPGLVDMGDYRNLVAFVRWAKEKYPAKRYFIDVWNHGSGWHKKRFGYMAPTDKDISWDDRFNSHITTKELGQAMTEIQGILGQKVDIYGSDACLMAMAEVAGEMKDSVKVFLGAEEVEPGEGWPYDKFLGPLVANPTMEAEDLARIHAKAFLDAYSGGEFGTQDVTMSAFSLEKFADLEAAMRSFAAEVKGATAPERTKIMNAVRATQGFYYSDYKDLVDFLDKLTAAGVTEVKASTIANLRSVAKSMIVANEVSNLYRSSHGMAFWLPARRSAYTSYAAKYNDLEFQKETGWGDALNQLLPAK